MSQFSSYLPAIVVGLVIVVILAVSRLIHVQYRNKNLLLPREDPVLRFPGRTVLQQLNKLNGDAIFYTSSLVIVPLLICAVYILQLHVSTIQFTRANILLLGVLALILTGVILIKTVSTLKQRRMVRLAYECAVAVGQELNRLMLAGYRIFHDFPAGEFNIDHIVVGSKGVFAVDTKARPSAASSSTGKEDTVEYNGHVLFFPDGKDLSTIERAGTHASWLSGWLDHTVGEPIATRAIVALPGWTVKRTSADGIPVVNPIQFPSLFEHIQPRHLSEDMINQIVDRIERRCRMVGSHSDHLHIPD